MTNLPNNPATRLLNIVNKARTIPGDLTVTKGWAKLLDLDTDDFPIVLQGIVDSLELVKDTRLSVQSLDSYNHNLYLEPINKIESAFKVLRFDVQWGTIQNYFDEKTIYGLSICSDLLSQKSSEKPLEDDALKELLDEVAALTEDIVASDLPDALKNFLLEQTEKLRSALLQYRIYGDKYLKSRLERVLGATFLYVQDISPFWEKPIIKRVFNLFTSIANVVTVHQGAQALASGIQRLLGISGS